LDSETTALSESALYCTGLKYPNLFPYLSTYFISDNRYHGRPTFSRYSTVAEILGTAHRY